MKKPSTTKLLTGEIVKGLDKKGTSSKYAEGALFSNVNKQMKARFPLSFEKGDYKKRYPNGGETEFIEEPEQVIPGSVRHKELLGKEKSYQEFLKKQEAYGPMIEQFGEPSVLSVEDFKKKYPEADPSFIPEGTTTIFGFTADVGEGGFGRTPESPIFGIAPSISGTRAYNFFPGYADPGKVPEYEVSDPLDIDLTLEPEAPYALPPEELLTSTKFIKQRPGAWYKDEQGKSIQAPKDAIWDETAGVYLDSQTGNVFNPRSGKVIRKYDPAKATVDTTEFTTVKESGVPIFEEGGRKEEYYTTLGDVLKTVFQKEGFEEGGKQSTEKLLTDEHITELEANKNVVANAEVEDGEYIKFPDGSVQKAYGEEHADGGIDMHLPDGAKILSNKRKLTKKQVKDLEKELDIKVSTKNTYAEAIDKYVEKIGLKKLYSEQEELFEELDKVLQDSQSEGSSRINQEYLSKKIHQIETQKEDKEKLKAELFDKVFTMQEVGKRGDENIDVEKFFEDGGISRDAFKKVVNRYGISEKEGIELYRGKIPSRLTNKYPDGGEHKDKPKSLEEAQRWYEEGKITREEADRYEVELANLAIAPPIKFTTTTGEHEFSNIDIYAREEQQAGEAAFGKITKENLPNVLNNLYRNFPDIVAEEYGVTYNEDGTISFNEDINFAQASKKVELFQQRAQKRMEDTANLIIANPDSFSPEYIQNAKNYLDNETFDDSLARGIDSKLGQFTSGRYSLGIDVVTPDEKNELETKGIFTTKQLQDAVDSGEIALSEGSLARLEKIRELTPEDADIDFSINTIESKEAPFIETEPTEPIKTIEQPDPTEGIIDDIVIPEKEYPRLFLTPDQTPLPPSAMEAHLMGQIKLERIDPTRIGVETELQQASDAVKEGVSSLSHLPPNQRAAAIVGIQANVQTGINEAIHKANIVNAQNQASAELFNIGQAGQEEQLKLNNLLSFEQRQLTAKAKTEEEVRNYYDQLNRINVNNFRNQQDLNLLQTLAPDYSLSPTGTGIEFTPEGEFKIQERSKYKTLFG